MFLIDTNVISEARKGRRADAGVQDFWAATAQENTPRFLAAVTIGELRRGVELIRHRGDQPQAQLLEQWLAEFLQTYGDRALDFDGDRSDLLHDLTVVTRNIDNLAGCGVRLLKPFQPPP